MAAYLPKWQIHAEEDFESFHLAPGEDGDMSMSVLAKVNAEGRFTGTFKCCVFGPNPISIRVPAAALLTGPTIPSNILLLRFEFSTHPEELTPSNNSTCTAWKDGVSSLMDRTVLLIDQQGATVDPLPVIAYPEVLGER
jgi:hypothetical protein